ncbi:40S ribosomal protein S4 [Binucleata daphniae]
MTRGPKRHLKRLAAPKSWMLDRMGGTFAPKPVSGPHRTKECIPLCLLLKKLNYAQTKKEIKHIVRNSMIKVNNKVRTEKNYPVGLFDVLSIEKTNEHFRLLYNINKRFYLHKISTEESKIRLCKVVKKKKDGDVPFCYTNDGFSFRFLDPAIVESDTLKIDIINNKVIEHVKFEEGKLAIITKGNNLGCIGTIIRIEKHEVGFDMIYLKDLNGRSFATRAKNAFVIGEVDAPLITLPNGRGIKVSVFELSNIKYGEIVEEVKEE